jgi:hypothetical protein
MISNQPVSHSPLCCKMLFFIVNCHESTVEYGGILGYNTCGKYFVLLFSQKLQGRVGKGGREGWNL